MIADEGDQIQSDQQDDNALEQPGAARTAQEADDPVNGGPDECPFNGDLPPRIAPKARKYSAKLKNSVFIGKTRQVERSGPRIAMNTHGVPVTLYIAQSSAALLKKGILSRQFMLTIDNRLHEADHFQHRGHVMHPDDGRPLTDAPSDAGGRAHEPVGRFRLAADAADKLLTACSQQQRLAKNAQLF